MSASAKYRDCNVRVERLVGNCAARGLFGDRIYEALLAREILTVICAQDASIDPARVVELANELNDLLIEEMNR